MKLLIVTFDPPENVGGVEGRLSGYVRELRKRNLFLEVEAFSRSNVNPTEKFYGVNYRKFSSRLTQLPKSMVETTMRMEKSKLDSVFLLSGGLTIFGNLLLLYSRITGRRTAMLLYGKDVLQAKRRFAGRILLQISTLLATRVLTNSWYTASLVPFVDSQKVGVLYPGVDPTLSESIEYSNVAPEGKILFVGRIIRRKGLRDLIDAFGLLSQEMPEIRLEIVGDGPERNQMERLTADLNLGSKVTFTGALRGIPLYERYTQCDVLAMPSITLDDDVEGFGTVFLEAGLFGKPSVGTRSGGIPEAIQDGRTGILVREGRVEDLAAALRRLMADSRLARTMGQSARKRVLNNFTWAHSTNQLIRSLS